MLAYGAITLLYDVDATLMPLRLIDAELLTAPPLMPLLRQDVATYHILYTEKKRHKNNAIRRERCFLSPMLFRRSSALRQLHHTVAL